MAKTLGNRQIPSVWWIAAFIAIWFTSTLAIDSYRRSRWVAEVEEWLRRQ